MNNKLSENTIVNVQRALKGSVFRNYQEQVAQLRNACVEELLSNQEVYASQVYSPCLTKDEFCEAVKVYRNMGNTVGAFDSAIPYAISTVLGMALHIHTREGEVTVYEGTAVFNGTLHIMR